MAKDQARDDQYEPTLVLPPGETLAEVLEQAKMTQAELAKRTGLSAKHINQLINGSAPISRETAILLERSTGISAMVWNNLESAYSDYVSRQNEEALLENDLGWLKELPVNELIKRGWVKKTKEPIDLLRSICRFFGVANRAAWDSLWQKPTAYRTSRAFKSDPGAVASWLRIGEIEAAAIDCEPFERKSLMLLIDPLRALTRDPMPARWFPKLVSECAGVGVAVVAEPEIQGARINGATRWLSSDKALIQLSLRHRWNDIFWFTFFHELGHLLLHSKKDTFINDVGAHSGVEQEADAFASQALIPRHHEAQLGELTTFDEVRDFAKRIGIDPGVVVGRLQHDGVWEFNRGNSLKQRFVFVE